MCFLLQIVPILFRIHLIQAQFNEYNQINPGSNWTYYDYHAYYDADYHAVPYQGLQCIDYQNCTLNCYDFLACWYTKIYGPKDATLTINCDSSKGMLGFTWMGEACVRMNINAENSSKLIVNVYNNDLEFSDNDVYAPYNRKMNITQIKTNTFIKCGIITPNTSNTATYKNCGHLNNIYSVYGLQTIEWTYYENTSWSLTPSTGINASTIHCGQYGIYPNNCELAVVDINIDREYECNALSNDKTCNNPLLIPTKYEYFDYNQPNAPFICPDDIDCILNCYGSLSCWTAVIYGPKNAELTVNCDSSRDIGPAGDSHEYGCNSLTIHAENSTKLSINVYNLPYELSDSTIYTPYYTSTFEKNTFILCGIYMTNDTFQGPTTDVCGYNNHIYSIDGWKSVQWSFENNSASLGIGWHNITMHCGYEYLTSCKSEVDSINIQYKCVLNKCDGIPTTQTPTTNEPTIDPSTNPTQYPTKDPTIYPTNDPTNNPSTNPTNHPSNYPTNTPSKYPTKYPTNDPTDNPTFYPTNKPSSNPSASPSKDPTNNPTRSPTNNPSTNPTNHPSNYPTKTPSEHPTKYPTNNPTYYPTNVPTNYPTNGIWDDFEACIDIDDGIFDDEGELIMDINVEKKRVLLSISGPNDKWFGIGFGNNKMLNTNAYVISEYEFDVNQRKLGHHKGGEIETLEIINDALLKLTIGSQRSIAMVRDYQVDIGYNLTDFIECNNDLDIIWAIGADLNFGLHLKNGIITIQSCLCPQTTANPTTNPTVSPVENISNADTMKLLISMVVTVMLLLPTICF